MKGNSKIEFRYVNMNKYFDVNDKVYDITEKYPDLIELLANNGFEQLRNDMLRKTLGKTISLAMALKSKKIDVETFEKQMVGVIENNTVELSSGLSKALRNDKDADVKIMGLLPCPIRMQMLEKMGEYIENSDIKINYELQSASMGLDFLKEDVEKAKSSKELADIYMSAGYGFFFDKEHIGKYANEGVFKDIAEVSEFNKDFQNENIDLRDPKGIYNIMGIVPAIFMVNEEALGDRKYPTSWKDLIDGEFEASVSIPTQDLDLFNAVLLGILTKYGKEGLKKLGKTAVSSMHPAQMIKNGESKRSAGPAVQIMPYFFTFVAKDSGPLKAIWPSDGAIVSPIFFISKKENEEKIKPLVNFLFSKEMGEVLSADGKFPSTNCKIDNNLGLDKKFIWPGFDFLHSNDIAKVLEEAADIFYGRKDV